MLFFSLLYGLSQSLREEVGGWLCSARRGHQGETEHRKKARMLGLQDKPGSCLRLVICHASVEVTSPVKWFNQQICLVSLQDALKGFRVNKMDLFLSMVKS